MIEANFCELRLVVSGCDYDEFRRAFRGSQWEYEWASSCEPVDDECHDLGFSLSLPITSWEMLVEGVRCMGTLRPKYTIGLYVTAKFPTGTVAMHLSKEYDNEEGPTCRFAPGSLTGHTSAKLKLADAGAAIAEVIDLLGMQDGAQ
jgi:hypothetical protein